MVDRFPELAPLIIKTESASKMQLAHYEQLLHQGNSSVAPYVRDAAITATIAHPIREDFGLFNYEVGNYLYRHSVLIESLDAYQMGLLWKVKNTEITHPDTLLLSQTYIYALDYLTAHYDQTEIGQSRLGLQWVRDNHQTTYNLATEVALNSQYEDLQDVFRSTRNISMRLMRYI